MASTASSSCSRARVHVCAGREALLAELAFGSPPGPKPRGTRLWSSRASAPGWVGYREARRVPALADGDLILELLVLLSIGIRRGFDHALERLEGPLDGVAILETDIGCLHEVR